MPRQSLFDDPDYYVEIEDVKALANTDRAVLVLIDEEKHWIPFANLGPESEVRVKGDEGALVVASWFARKEGLV